MNSQVEDKKFVRQTHFEVFQSGFTMMKMTTRINNISGLFTLSVTSGLSGLDHLDELCPRTPLLLLTDRSVKIITVRIQDTGEQASAHPQALFTETLLHLPGGKRGFIHRVCQI